MKKWVLTALVYLAVVFGIYGVWSNYSATHKPASNTENAKQQTMPGMSGTSQPKSNDHMHDDEMEGMDMNAPSEVTPTVSYANGVFTIKLRDKAGEPVDDLVLNHEKLMHFIVVSDDLKQYYHLHPERTNAGEYQVPFKLQDGDYKAFVDIKPDHKNYHVDPIEVQVGTAGVATQPALTPDANLTQSYAGHVVTLTPSAAFKVGEEITLNFSFQQNEIPEPYLGALGHVVILDEKAQTYLHVHPSTDKDTKFETKFEKPGIYKIWAEFQFNGKVHAYPFVVHVQ